jgi:hypothetical protein
VLFRSGKDPDVIMDFTLVVNTMNFAFTDFSTGVKFETDYIGKRWSSILNPYPQMEKAVFLD